MQLLDLSRELPKKKEVRKDGSAARDKGRRFRDPKKGIASNGRPSRVVMCFLQRSKSPQENLFRTFKRRRKGRCMQQGSTTLIMQPAAQRYS